MPASAEEVMSGSEEEDAGPPPMMREECYPALHLGGTLGLAFWKCYPATILPGYNSKPGTIFGVPLGPLQLPRVWRTSYIPR